MRIFLLYHIEVIIHELKIPCVPLYNNPIINPCVHVPKLVCPHICSIESQTAVWGPFQWKSPVLHINLHSSSFTSKWSAAAPYGAHICLLLVSLDQSLIRASHQQQNKEPSDAFMCSVLILCAFPFVWFHVIVCVFDVMMDAETQNLESLTCDARRFDVEWGQKGIRHRNGWMKSL